MADIIYDIDKLLDAKRAIDNLVDTLEKDNNDLTAALEQLKKEWHTDSGEKFFKDHKDTWSDYVKKYVKKLKGVSDMLQAAIEQYEQIDSEVRNLKV